ncbi:hypothetical protein C8F01DRAFT_1088524 [Mycena amicta]|nr:hypothetical protein C8F01DRAFT_1088524 [Mycena amicta]
MARTQGTPSTATFPASQMWTRTDLTGTGNVKAHPHLASRPHIITAQDLQMEKDQQWTRRRGTDLDGQEGGVPSVDENGMMTVICMSGVGRAWKVCAQSSSNLFAYITVMTHRHELTRGELPRQAYRGTQARLQETEEQVRVSRGQEYALTYVILLIETQSGIACSVGIVLIHVRRSVPVSGWHARDLGYVSVIIFSVFSLAYYSVVWIWDLI